MSHRGLISGMLLLVQVLGMGHLAVSHHLLSNTGAVVDAVELSPEPHSHAAEHLCEGDVSFHAQGAGDECLVVASWKAPAFFAPVTVLTAEARGCGELTHFVSRGQSPLAVLFVAPKASPPRS